MKKLLTLLLACLVANAAFADQTPAKFTLENPSRVKQQALAAAVPAAATWAALSIIKPCMIKVFNHCQDGIKTQFTCPNKPDYVFCGDCNNPISRLFPNTFDKIGGACIAAVAGFMCGEFIHAFTNDGILANAKSVIRTIDTTVLDFIKGIQDQASLKSYLDSYYLEIVSIVDPNIDLADVIFVTKAARFFNMLESMQYNLVEAQKGLKYLQNDARYKEEASYHLVTVESYLPIINHGLTTLNLLVPDLQTQLKALQRVENRQMYPPTIHKNSWHYSSGHYYYNPGFYAPTSDCGQCPPHVERPC